jgi:hypothetical protein
MPAARTGSRIRFAQGSGAARIGTRLGPAWLALLVVGSAAHGANLLANDPGFESVTSALWVTGPVSDSSSIPGWQIVFTQAQGSAPTNNNVYRATPAAEGTNALGISATGAMSLETLAASRPTISAGRVYTMQFALNYGLRSQVAGIGWYNGAGTLVGRSTNAYAATMGWQTNVVTATAPAGASKASAYYNGIGDISWSSGQGRFVAGYVELDNFSLSTNNPPVVNAGATQVKPVGATISLAGSATDPNGDTLTYAWSQVSGPATVNFASPGALNTTATGFSAIGVYQLRLTVRDGTYTVASDVFISTSGNLLGNNAGFESVPRSLWVAGPVADSSSIPGWQLVLTQPNGDSPTNNNAYCAGSATAYPSPADGTNALGLSATGTMWLETLPDARAPVTPNTYYTLSFAMKYAMKTQVEGIRWYDSGGALIGASTNSFYADALSGNFQPFYLNAYSPPGAATASAYYYAVGNISYSSGQAKDVAGYVELDNFAIRTNNPPVVYAGPQIAGFTNRVTLAGAVSDPNGDALTYTWSVIDGPGSATLANPNALNSAVTLSTIGTYVLRLTASDGTYSVFSDVYVGYLDPLGNLLGYNCGFEATNAPIYIESSGQTDYSMPGWVVTFTVPTVNPKLGNNVGLQSNGGNNGLYMDCYAGGVVSIETAPNCRAPIASPGSVYKLALQQSAVPDGCEAEVRWFTSAGVYISSGSFVPTGAGYPNYAPTSAKFVSPANAAWAGVYYPSTGGFGMVDAFSISLSTGNEPPLVYAGGEMTRVMGAPIVLAGLASDGDPLDVLLIAWSKVSGPGTVTFANAGALRTGVSFGALGDYVLRLTVDDQHGHVLAREVKVHIVNPTGERVLVFCGQSNMEGHGTPNTITNLPAHLRNEITNVYGFYANEMDWIGGLPETKGDRVYDDGVLYHWASMKTNIVYGGVTNGYYLAGGTYQPYAFFKTNWVGYSRTSPTDPTRKPFTIAKGTTNLLYWPAGLNPGEPWANAWTFTSGEPNMVYGPELTAAWTLHGSRPNEKFWIVKYAPGGTSLAGNWNPDRQSGSYAGMSEWVECALAERPGAQLAGFFWLQGESDCGSGSRYYQDLTNLIGRVRADFAVPTLPVVIGQIHPGNPQDPGPDVRYWTNSNYGVVWFGGTNGIYKVRKAQLDAASTIPGVMTVNADDFRLLTFEWHQASAHNRNLNGDVRNNAVHFNVVTNANWAPVHFGDDAIQAIGTRMAQAWLSLDDNTRPLIDSASLLAGGRFSFGFSGSGSSNAMYEVYALPDLTQTNWTYVGVATQSPPASGEFSFTDPNTVSWPRRFYKLQKR